MSRTLEVAAGDRFVYDYDFGDDWLHDVVIEKKLPFEDAGGLLLHRVLLPEVDGDRLAQASTVVRRKNMLTA